MSIGIDILRRSWFLTGPTASGKTAVSLSLAASIGAEIISLDSMAIYRGMDLGTAKPTIAERSVVPHHLIDVADPQEDYSVAQFLRLAGDAAVGVVERGRVPLFVGGTGLYLRSVLRGLFEGPEADWGLREELQVAAREHGPAWLHRQLRGVDPATADRLHENDLRRIIRAIEVFRLTGRRLSDDQTQPPRPPADQPKVVVWLNPPREWMHHRIEMRVDAMIREGWLKEARWLNQLDPPAGRTASLALGYPELMAHLRGECSLESAVEKIKAGTRQFAKRQVTWFRNLPECRALALTGRETIEEISQRIRDMSST